MALFTVKAKPADLPSRGVSASFTEQLKAWLRGPEFLPEAIFTLVNMNFQIKNYLKNPALQIDSQYMQA